MLKLMIIGNLTADPETRFVDTANGVQEVCNFTVAVNYVYKGEKTARYFRVSCWNKQAENAGKYLRKGSKVYVSASQITARTYTARNGQIGTSMELTADEIEYLSSKSDGGHQETGQDPPQPAAQVDDNGFADIPDEIDDDLPFH